MLSICLLSLHAPNEFPLRDTAGLVDTIAAACLITMEFDFGVESLGGGLLDYRSHSDECVCSVCGGDGADSRVDSRRDFGENEGRFPSSANNFR
jgi:hypothetical protein